MQDLGAIAEPYDGCRRFVILAECAAYDLRPAHLLFFNALYRKQP